MACSYLNQLQSRYLIKLQERAHVKPPQQGFGWLLPGFEILSRGSDSKDGTPDIYVRGKAAYRANLNPESPHGTIASIDGTLRGLDRLAPEEQSAIERHEQALADYRAQLGRPFEHEARLCGFHLRRIRWCLVYRQQSKTRVLSSRPLGFRPNVRRFQNQPIVLIDLSDLQLLFDEICGNIRKINA
jgi:hypothetical protein